MSRVLIIEDDETIAQGMARHLAAAGFDPVTVGSGDQGLARLRFPARLPWVYVPHGFLPLLHSDGGEGRGEEVIAFARGNSQSRCAVN